MQCWTLQAAPSIIWLLVKLSMWDMLGACDAAKLSRVCEALTQVINSFEDLFYQFVPCVLPF